MHEPHSGERIFRRCAAHSADERFPRPSAVAKLCRRYAAALSAKYVIALAAEANKHKIRDHQPRPMNGIFVAMTVMN
jgi:hypothetical protein